MCMIRDDQDGLVIFFCCNDEISDQTECECTCRMVITMTLRQDLSCSKICKVTISRSMKRAGWIMLNRCGNELKLFSVQNCLCHHTLQYVIFVSATIKWCVQFETFCFCVLVVVMNDDICGTNRQPETASLSLAKTLNNKLAFCFSGHNVLTDEQQIAAVGSSSLRNSIQHSPRYSVALLNWQRPSVNTLEVCKTKQSPDTKLIFNFKQNLPYICHMPYANLPYICKTKDSLVRRAQIQHSF